MKRGSVWECDHCHAEVVTVPGAAPPACKTCNAKRGKGVDGCMRYRGGRFLYAADDKPSRITGKV